MTASEILWSLGMLGLWAAACLAFARFRRRTRDYRETRVFKSELPLWVRLFEKTMLYGLVLSMGAGTFWVFGDLHGVAHPGGQVAGATAMFSVLGSALVALPIAALSANALSWIIPPVRSANLLALSGLHVSFASLNRGLLLVGAVSVPVGLIQLVLAIIEPWAR